MQHSIELYLKAILQNISEINTVKSKTSDSLNIKTHDLQKIISNIDTLSKAIGDNRLKSQVKKLKSISDQCHDRNNEMCRYPVNKKEEVIVLQQQVDI